MADDALKFQVNLAGNIVSELIASGKAANTAEGNIQALTGAILGLTEASKEKEKDSGFFVFDLAKGADMAIGLVKSLASEVWDLGKAIVGAAASTQDLDVALRANVGEAGEAQVKEIVRGFRDTRFGGHRLEQELLPLLNVGMGGDPAHLQNIVTAATDIAARTNNEGAIGETLEAFKRVHTRREVNTRMLMALGLNEKDFYKSLGETIGRNATDAEAQVKAGKVKAEALEAELLGLIAKREGGKLGTATDESAKTLGTTLARLERIPREIYNDLANSPGLQQLQDRADQFINTMGESGKARIETAIGGALTRIGDDLFGDEKAADKFIAAFEKNLPKAITLIETLAHWTADLVRDVGKLAELWPLISDIGKGAAAGAAGGALVGGVGAVPGAILGGIYGAVRGELDQGEADARHREGIDVTPGGGGASGSWEPMPQAHDFMWRGGKAVELDPSDTITGAKGDRGALLERLMSGGGSSGGPPVTLAPELHFHLAPGTPHEQVRGSIEHARVELARICDEARARFGGRP